MLPDIVDAWSDVIDLTNFVEEIQQLVYWIPKRSATETSRAILFQFGDEWDSSFVYEE